MGRSCFDEWSTGKLEEKQGLPCVVNQLILINILSCFSKDKKAVTNLVKAAIPLSLSYILTYGEVSVIYFECGAHGISVLLTMVAIALLYYPHSGKF